jgi:septum site-determining protein MinD
VERGEMLSVEDVTEILAIPLIGVIPESKAVLKASNTGTPVTLDEASDAGVAYQDAIARFLGESKPMKFISNEKKGLLRRLFSKNREDVPA